jgi:lysophospholipase L1-like esterase
MNTVLVALVLAQAPADPFAKWEKEIAGIEKRIAAEKPGQIVFAGSSSIRLWDLKKSFPEWNVVNVGFGGSTIPDSTHFHSRIIKPLKPKAIVFYAGDNDIAAKRSAETVRDDYAAFVKAVRAADADVPVYFLAIKASVKRWDMVETQKKANGYVQDIIKKDAKQQYIDTVPLLFGADGTPHKAYFKDDGLHLNDKGYAKWAAAVKAVVK